LSIAFAIICCGNSLFGILLLPASRVLGEISYSIYLLHGLFLYCTFKLGLGDALAAGLSVYEHWAVVLGLAPVLVGVAFVTFSFIEAPAYAAGGVCPGLVTAVGVGEKPWARHTDGEVFVYRTGAITLLWRLLSDC
jgi:peptidoglycan/LPS O-acetylase OafA/YrhL